MGKKSLVDQPMVAAVLPQRIVGACSEARTATVAGKAGVTFCQMFVVPNFLVERRGKGQGGGINQVPVSRIGQRGSFFEP
jgi:hypothetical protein